MTFCSMALRYPVVIDNDKMMIIKQIEIPIMESVTIGRVVLLSFFLRSRRERKCSSMGGGGG